MRMPETMLNWKNPTSRPRLSAGAISAMYMGPITLEPPIARPPTKRKNTTAYQLNANAHPAAERT